MSHAISSEGGCVTNKLKLCHAILGNSVTYRLILRAKVTLFLLCYIYTGHKLLDRTYK